jgi:hypothetical protein
LSKLRRPASKSKSSAYSSATGAARPCSAGAADEAAAAFLLPVGSAGSEDAAGAAAFLAFFFLPGGCGCGG